MSWDEQFDLVCVGSGAGGLSAAITAADAGARAVVLERGPLLGGVTALSLGQIWLGNNHLAEAAGIADTVPETSQYLDFLAAGLIDRVRQQGFIEHAREALQYLHDAGFAVEVIRDCPDYY
jgi:3-oxosteroid 1-dehydrogenase